MTCIVDRLGSPSSPTVVFLHGAGGNRGMWATYSSDQWFGLVPDLPGHGSCSKGRWTMEASIEAVATLIEEQSPSGRAVLCGSSLGGYVAIATAHARPDLVEGLVLSGSTASYLGWGGFETRAFGWAVKAFGPVIRRLNAKALADLPPEIGGPMIEGGMSTRAASDALIRLPGTDYHALLRAYEGPVLVLNGERDKVNRKEEHEAIEGLANASLQVLDDCGHSCVITKPDAFKAAVEAFVATLRADR